MNVLVCTWPVPGECTDPLWHIMLAVHMPRAGHSAAEALGSCVGLRWQQSPWHPHRLSAVLHVVCRLQQQAQLKAQLPVPRGDGPSTPVQQVTKQAGRPLVTSEGTASLPGSSKGKQRGRAAIRLSASTAELGLAPGPPAEAGALHVVARCALGPDGAAGDLGGAGDAQGSTFASQVLQVSAHTSCA